jgi:fructose-1,6-bisphosphatase/inositol monophosphatase family enzyme
MDPREDIPAAERAHFAAFAAELIAESRRVIHAALARGFEVKHKPDGSYVTSVDVAVEERLRALIAARFPAHGILGEEQPPVRPDAEFQWILDPIDGTEDFVHRMPTFGTILGLHYRDAPLIGVVDHPLLALIVRAAYRLGTFCNDVRVRLDSLAAGTADPAVRVMLSARANFIRHSDDGPLFDAIARRFSNHRIYRSCYAHACVASGQADVMIEYGNRIWDLAAAPLLVEEAGGRYVSVQDVDVPGVGRVLGAVFGKSGAVERILALIAARRPTPEHAPRQEE